MAKSNTSSTFDSGQQYLATVYAKALLGATQQSANTEAVLEELDSLIDDVLDSLPNLDATLSSPRVPLEDKVAMLDKAFADKMAKDLLNFLKVVCGHGRFDCVRAMRKAAHRLFNEARNRVEVSVRSAEELDQTTTELIAKRLREALGSDVSLTTEVDPELIGGLVVRVGDTVFDGSVANRLLRIRKDAVERTTQEIRKSLDRFVLAE